MTASISRVNQTFLALRRHLGEIVPVSPESISPKSRFVDLVRSEERQRVWQQLHEAGVALPELGLSSRALFAAASVVLLPVALLCLLFHWSSVLFVVELHALARKVTRPWAIVPPCGCESLEEAALHLTPFCVADHRAGLWSEEEIAAKVRLIVCRSLGISFDKINGDIRFAEICDC